MVTNPPSPPPSNAPATVDERDALPVTLRIVHVRHIRTGDYFLGAQFQQPLSVEAMRPFLAEP